MVHDNCAEQIQLCLPIYAIDDIAFQFINSQPYNYFFYSVNYDAYESPLIAAPHVFTYGTGKLILHTGISAAEWAKIPCGKCFTLKYYWSAIPDKDKTLLFNTVCLERICDPCWTSKISYRCDENSFDFIYSQDIASHVHFYNIIRLPFYLTEPQYPIKRNVFVKSNGSRKKLSSRIENSYELVVDYMPKSWHEKLIVALEHDTVLITNTNSEMVNQEFTQEKEYKIDWERFMNYPTAPAKGQLMLTPYFNVNSNCS